MRTRSKAPLTVAAIASLFALAACSGQPGGADDVELRMTIWSADPDHVALFEELGDEFAEQNPRVADVTIESFNLAELDTLLTTQIQAGDPPDVSWLPVESSLEYGRAGALADLAPTIAETDGFDYDDLIPRLTERWVDGDSVYGIPFSTGPLVMYYNKDLYEKAGVKDPSQLIADDEWTWDEFRKTSKQLHDELDVPAYQLNDFDFKNWTRLLPYMNAYGASPWSDDAATCTLDSDEMVDALSVFHGMTFEDGSMPVPGQQVDFWGGQVGATSAFLGANGNLADADFEWDLVPTPSGPAGDVMSTGQASMVALAAGENSEEAAQLVAFLGSKESMAKYSGYFPPIRESLLTPEILTQNSEVLTPELVQPVIDGIKENGQVFPVSANNAAVADAVNSSLDEHLYQPDADVGQALTDVCADVAPELK